MFSKCFTRLDVSSLKSIVGTDNLFHVYSSLRNLGLGGVRDFHSASGLLDEGKSKIFFSKEAQILMKRITGLDLEKVYRKRSGHSSVRPPTYEFMTTEQLKDAQKAAIRRAYSKLQMPPMLPRNKGEVEILDENPQMIGFTKSNYVFTDISYNVADRKRLIVVREPSGLLRKALPFERHRMNELYFPRPGRSYEHPEMFQKENLRRILDEGNYEFVLDRACAQFEPDDEEFHDAAFMTYDVVSFKKDFDKLRSTRHFGPMVFYVCMTKNVGKLIEENLETERLNDACDIAKLYTLVNPDCKFRSLNLSSEDKIEYLRKFIEHECAGPEKSLQLLDTYWEAQKEPISCDAGQVLP